MRFSFLGKERNNASQRKEHKGEAVVALAGNPNVGKSTLFNGLTGLHQHTGNWPGKTVSQASGSYHYNGKMYRLVDLPGTYSLLSHSQEEEIAEHFICFEEPDAVVVVCDATCLERNLNLLLQILEMTGRVVVCVNLMDEAEKKSIRVDLKALSRLLGVEVISTCASRKKGLRELMQRISLVMKEEKQKASFRLTYSPPIEEALRVLIPVVEAFQSKLSPRFLSLKLLMGEDDFFEENKELCEIKNHEGVKEAREKAEAILKAHRISMESVKDCIVSEIMKRAEDIAHDVILFENRNYHKRDRAVDRILTHRFLGIPAMLLLLGGVFWLTLVGANYPSAWLSGFFGMAEEWLLSWMSAMAVPEWLSQMLCCGVFRVVGWIVSVMLPPMAIFFPLFTLLEDFGYLPRVAFNLDKAFQRCSACGKQALTMCMGFGCNAAGVVGSRIIDSPRERLIAILTNSFVPCNGRFPLMIAMITMFFSVSSPLCAVWNAMFLTAIVMTGIFMTFLVSFFLSKTLLKGEASSFTLELPPYRRPKIGSVIVRSLFDRSLFVLARALLIAAPAGLVIWLFSNMYVNGISVFQHCCNFLHPFALKIGLDGVILMAFVLALPANEIVIPIILMGYSMTTTLTEAQSLTALKELLVAHGWSIRTALCTMLFSLFHWPCSTTLMTIRKETGSFKWMLIGALLPTLIGVTVCFLVNSLWQIFI